MATKKDFTILQGETFQRIIRWETPPYVYAPITGITQAAPVSLTVVGHGLKTGWRAAVVSALGMTEINTVNSPLRDSDFHQVTVVDPNTVTINDINSFGFSPYISGGYLQSFTPVVLTGYSAKMEIKDRVGGNILMTLSSNLGDNRIIIDTTNYTITLNVAATDVTAALITWRKGVYDLEMTGPTGTVTRIFTGSIKISPEVTT